MASIYISCDETDKSFATDLKYQLDNLGQTAITLDDFYVSLTVTDMIKKVDVVIFLVSKELSTLSNVEHGIALAYSNDTGRPIIISVILGDAEIPSMIPGKEYIKADNLDTKELASDILRSIELKLDGLDIFDQHILDKNEPLVLLLGNVDHEGVLSSLRTVGRQYKKKMLESKPDNWQLISEYFDDYAVKSVLIKLNGRVLTLLASDDYKDVTHTVLSRIGSIPNIVFVYNNLLTGIYQKEDDDFYKPLEKDRQAAIQLLEAYNVNVMPYQTNAEVTVMAISFLTEAEQNLIFRLYIPAGRMWANETDRLLQMFRDYLTRVGQLSVRLDQYRTDKGIIYEFHGEEPKGQNGLTTEFAEFTQLMDLCISNPTAAEAMLLVKKVAPREILDILARYSKEAKRIQVDLKHDRERKILCIRQRLESELVDVLPANVDWAIIGSLVESSVPAISGSSSAISIDQGPIRLTSLQESPNITINLKPQIIQTVNGIVAQEIHGDQYLTRQDQELLSLIQKYGGEKTAVLASAVHELADKSAPSHDRLNAKQKLKKFLISVGDRAGDIAVGLLQKYIENKFGM